MRDPNYGWNMEMQVKAIELGLRILEVPVRYKRRIGVSKISGTVRGTVAAGYKILSTLFLLRLRGIAHGRGPCLRALRAGAKAQRPTSTGSPRPPILSEHDGR